MNLLLDSNVLVWLLVEPDRIGAKAREALATPSARRAYSAVSPWEIAIKCAKGHLHMPPRWLETFGDLGLQEIKITAEAGVQSANLPWHHRDPFDRMIVSHALRHGMTLVTRDTFLAAYGVRMIAA